MLSGFECSPFKASKSSILVIAKIVRACIYKSLFNPMSSSMPHLTLKYVLDRNKSVVFYQPHWSVHQRTRMSDALKFFLEMYSNNQNTLLCQLHGLKSLQKHFSTVYVSFPHRLQSKAVLSPLNNGSTFKNF